MKIYQLTLELSWFQIVELNQFRPQQRGMGNEISPVRKQYIPYLGISDYQGTVSKQGTTILECLLREPVSDRKSEEK